MPRQLVLHHRPYAWPVQQAVIRPRAVLRVLATLIFLALMEAHRAWRVRREVLRSRAVLRALAMLASRGPMEAIARRAWQENTKLYQDLRIVLTAMPANSPLLLLHQHLLCVQRAWQEVMQKRQVLQAA